MTMQKANLSVQVARVPSVAAIGIVAHEVGTRCRIEGYVPLRALCRRSDRFLIGLSFSHRLFCLH